MAGLIAIDTETDEGRPYSIQVSLSSGAGLMVLISDTKTLQRLVERINALVKRGWVLVFHHALADLWVSNLGIDCSIFRDTMQELFHLGNLPQGLKAAVYRVFGYRMTSYDEVVTPHSKAVLDHWLAEAVTYASETMSTLEPHPKGPSPCPTCGTKHKADMSVRKRHKAETTLRHTMNYLADSPDYDPWLPPKLEKGVEKFRLLGRPWLDEVEQAVGRMPRRSIVHAPIAQQVGYACSDADWTGRLATWLEGERRRIVEQEWRVA